MTRKVELFESNNPFDLQKYVNDFLETIRDDEYIDIQYNAPNMQDMQPGMTPIWTAMVVYRGRNES
jgi:sporulation protein Cse60